MNPALEALQFVQSLEPIFQKLKPDSRKKLAANLIADLTRISVLCGYSDGEFSEEELLVAMLFTAAVFAYLADEPFGAFSSRASARNYLQHWESLEQASRERVVRSLTEGLERHFDRDEKDLDLERLATPASVRYLDELHGSDFAHGASAALYRFAQVLIKIDGELIPEEERALKKVWRLAFGQAHPSAPASESAPENDHRATEAAPEPGLEEVEVETLDEVLAELEGLVGMGNIKEEVRTLANFLKIQQEREKRDMPRTPVSLHMVFTGPPGTGKTTVARIVSRVYRAMGLLKKGHLVETDRAGLVGSYVGHTSKKVAEKVDEALDGVLFIDEAYALKPEEAKSDFGQEAIDVLLKRMEDHRERLVVIAAGYSDEMQRFIDSNPGLKSRFNRYLHFDHYPPADLLEIFKIFSKKANYALHPDAETKLLDVFGRLHAKRDRSFGNGRLARNLFEKVIERQANRLAGVVPLSDEAIAELAAADVPDFPEDKSPSWFETLLAKIGIGD